MSVDRGNLGILDSLVDLCVMFAWLGAWFILLVRVFISRKITVPTNNHEK